MWIYTKLGHFSAVCARHLDDVPISVDRDTIVVRARLESHIEALRDWMLRTTITRNPVDIQVTPNRDYRARVVITKRQWRRVLMGLATEIDYDNFKSAVHADRNRVTGKAASEHDEYTSMLSACWGIGARAQDRTYRRHCCERCGKTLPVPGRYRIVTIPQLCADCCEEQAREDERSLDLFDMAEPTSLIDPRLLDDTEAR